MCTRAASRFLSEGFGQLTDPEKAKEDQVWHAGWESEGAWIKNLEWNWKEKTKNGEEIKDDFFEGAEKLLEVRFGEGAGDLRRLGRQDLEEILTLARCEIISTISNGSMTAHVLSESSLFVDKNRIVLKTCGTTSPLDCLPRLLEMAREVAGQAGIERIIYSRKNFEEPGLQPSPHRCWGQEALRLRSLFQTGSAYSLGPINRDCWHFFTMDNRQGVWRPEQKLELMMTDLEQEKMEVFHQAVSRDGPDARKRSGIDQLLPGMVMDDFLFQPFGYSMNGIAEDSSGDPGIEYMTIHVTPQPSCSYASFETTSSSCSLQLVRQVLNIFRPGSFILSFYATESSSTFQLQEEFRNCLQIQKWKRRDLQICNNQGWEVTYANFSKAII